MYPLSLLTAPSPLPPILILLSHSCVFFFAFFFCFFGAGAAAGGLVRHSFCSRNETWCSEWEDDVGFQTETETQSLGGVLVERVCDRWSDDETKDSRNKQEEQIQRSPQFTLILFFFGQFPPPIHPMQSVAVCASYVANPLG
ncbi:hypothetical protein DFP73DRAFT_548418 [Morchella snyderi]|nr:hypothetical protein DFP73DRAFT_548418 [Morchella snyderi]